jgi:contractile injection system tape measure protein
MHVRCRAAASDADRALALRRRLEDAARTHLPAALARVADRDERRVFAERLEVRLDFEAADYDDVTVAALWAARVESALAEHRAAGDPGVVAYETDREFWSAAAEEWADSGGLGWQFEELDCGIGARLAAPAVLAAFDRRERVAALARALVARPERLERVRLRLAPAERRAVVDALTGARPWGRFAAPAAKRRLDERDESGAPPAAAADDPPDSPARRGARGALARAGDRAAPGRAVDDRAEWRAAWRRCAASDALDVRAGPSNVVSAPATVPIARKAHNPGARTRPGDGREAAKRLAREERSAPPPAGDAHARRHGVEPGPLDERIAWLTRWAGLALLYPWLEDHMTPAPDQTARTWALAVLADPADPGRAALDPFVRALAGDDPRRDPCGRPLVPPGELAELIAAGDAVLRSLAALLPGFERSTPAYLRRELVCREGMLERARAGVFALVLERKPLDVLIDLLPFPLAPFRMPWTDAFEPSLRGHA